jgi:hypothetical protein
MTPPSNPLRHVLLSLNLSPAGLAHALDLEPAAVRAALKEHPCRAVAAYARLWNALRVMPPRLTVAERPVRFVVRLDSVDALYRDDGFRRSRGLLDMPPTVGELRQLVRRLSRQRSLLSIVRRLEGSYIPTARGLASWRKSTVAQTLKGGNPEDPRPLAPGSELVERWRRYCLAVISSSACPPDPAAIARYRYETHLDAGGTTLRYESTRPMPACVAEWTRAGLKGMRIRLGVEVLDDASDDASHVPLDDLGT